MTHLHCGWRAGAGMLAARMLAAGMLAAGMPARAAADPAAPAAAAALGACRALPASRMSTESGDLLLRDPQGTLLARWPLRDAQGQAGMPLAVCALPPRQSLVVVVQGWQELWEISTDPAAPPIFDGLVHDYRMGEAIARPGHLGIRRIRLQRPWAAVFADARVPWIVGAEPQPDGSLQAVVLHLDIRREVVRLPLGPAPAAGPLAGTQVVPSDDGAWLLQLPLPGGGQQVLHSRRWQRP